MRRHSATRLKHGIALRVLASCGVGAGGGPFGESHQCANDFTPSANMTVRAITLTAISPSAATPVRIGIATTGSHTALESAEPWVAAGTYADATMPATSSSATLTVTLNTPAVLVGGTTYSLVIVRQDALSGGSIGNISIAQTPITGVGLSTTGAHYYDDGAQGGKTSRLSGGQYFPVSTFYG